jgi:hypothetical protein
MADGQKTIGPLEQIFAQQLRRSHVAMSPKTAFRSRMGVSCISPYARR